MCPKCQFVTNDTFYFCPNCGYKLKNKALTVTAADQIKLYLLSFLLPPFGLIPSIKYLRGNSPKTKTVGVVGVVLTIISVILAIWITYSFFASLNSALDKQLGL